MTAGRTNLTISIRTSVAARLREIKAETGVSAGFLAQQALTEFLDLHYPCADEIGIVPADRLSIKQAMTTESLKEGAKWTEAASSIKGRCPDSKGRLVEFEGVYTGGQVILHSVWIRGQQAIFTFSDVLSAEECSEANQVLTEGMALLEQSRRSRN